MGKQSNEGQLPRFCSAADAGDTDSPATAYISSAGCWEVDIVVVEGQEGEGLSFERKSIQKGGDGLSSVPANDQLPPLQFFLDMSISLSKHKVCISSDSSQAPSSCYLPQTERASFQTILTMVTSVPPSSLLPPSLSSSRPSSFSEILSRSSRTSSMVSRQSSLVSLIARAHCLVSANLPASSRSSVLRRL